MMNENKMKVLFRAVKIRIGRGESLEDVISSYNKLTKEEIEAIRKNVEPLDKSVDESHVK